MFVSFFLFIIYFENFLFLGENGAFVFMTSVSFRSAVTILPDWPQHFIVAFFFRLISYIPYSVNFLVIFLNSSFFIPFFTVCCYFSLVFYLLLFIPKKSTSNGCLIGAP